MQISAHLDQLRSAFPDCRAIAYSDLGAQMILVTSADEDMPQERWDDLCDTGVALLTGEPAQHAIRAMIRGVGTAHAIVLDADEMGLFVRSGPNPEDAILCVARLTLPVTEFIAQAGDLLGRIAQDD